MCLGSTDVSDSWADGVGHVFSIEKPSGVVVVIHRDGANVRVWRRLARSGEVGTEVH